MESVLKDNVLCISLANLIAGLVYSGVHVSGKKALEDLELAEQLIVQYLSKSDEKGGIFVDVFDCSRTFTFGDI